MELIILLLILYPVFLAELHVPMLAGFIVLKKYHLQNTELT
jgi:hypothetical protein